MNKKKTLLLLLSSTTLATAAVTMAVVNNSKGSLSLEQSKANGEEYTLTYSQQAATSGNIDLLTVNGKYSSSLATLLTPEKRIATLLTKTSST